jgi:predicted DNA-binding protein
MDALSVRLPRQIIRRLEKVARRQGRDRSEFLREMIEKGLAADQKRRVLEAYAAAKLSAGAAAIELGTDPWGFSDLLRKENLDRNVSLEDILSSGRL